MADPTAPRVYTRRTFIAWWMTGLLTAFAVTAVAPMLVFLWPAPPKGQRKTTINVSLPTPLDQLADGDAIRFDAPTNPDSAFVMIDGGGDNAAGELAFSAYVVKVQSKINVFAINCPHLGCSYALNTLDKTFDCPCHGSRFHLDGTVLHGPAAYPLSHLKWEQGGDPNTIVVDGVILGF